MTSLLNFIKIYQLVQQSLGGTQTDRRTDRHTDRQTGDLISLTFLFKESRLITDFVTDYENNSELEVLMPPVA
jgi:hypothetical protein